MQEIARGAADDTRRRYPWPMASATGIGSMPGGDPAEAMRVVAGELPDFPHLVELPGRGPGADLTGRTAALLVDLPVETTPRGWRLAEHPGRDLRAARSMLAADLDALEEVMAGYAGPVKVAVAGPWTLAATIELPRRLDAVLTDQGAVADLAASLVEGVTAHLVDVRRRLPAADLVVQVDEPALPAVASGAVPTASGLARIAAVEADVLAGRLGDVLAATGGYTVVHCCATPIPFGIVAAAAADGIAFDLGLLRRSDEDAVGEAVDAGRGLLLGVLGSAIAAEAPPPGPPPPESLPAGPGLSPQPAGPGAAPPTRDPLPSPRTTAERVARLWRGLGMPADRCAEQVVLTPACGLAGTSPERARAVLAHCRQAARMLPELAEAYD